MKASTTSPNGYALAYETIPGTAPGVLFLSGFKSDMSGQKAQALFDYCSEQGIAFTRFDYGGHGASGGSFEQGNISQWLADALHIFDSITEGNQILVGSSMGGWVALLLARLRPERVAGLIGIAAAPDFTERLIWNVATEEQKAMLKRDGFFAIPNCYGTEPYNITLQLIEDGRKHLLLDAPIAIDCPVHLLHGTHDEDVPLDVADALMERLPNATLTTIAGGNHRLSEPEHLATLKHTLHAMLKSCREK